MNTSLLAYFETNLLKKGETLELLHLAENKQAVIDIPIIKQLETRIKQVGLLTFSIEDFSEFTNEAVDENLLSLKISPKKKILMNEISESIALRWIHEGWLVKEIRFKKDGRTVDASYYRMGYHLYKWHQRMEEQKQNNLKNELADWKDSISTILSGTSTVSRDLINEQAFQSLYQYIFTISRETHHALMNPANMPEKWSVKKKFQFLYFLAAILQICMEKTDFDWKEIGAKYYQEIGGSKKFDAYKEEFLSYLEDVIQYPVSYLGLISLGKITPLFFSGNISGRFSEYKYGPVHSLTDLAIAQEDLRSSAKTLWLVENRAILTRISAEAHFLQENQILLVCVDGHLRSSHKNCIKQLTKNSRFSQIIIWTDYDKAGLHIAEELYQAAKNQTVLIKWITNDHKILTSWNHYQEKIGKLILDRKIEQEVILGDMEDWKKWIQLQ